MLKTFRGLNSFQISKMFVDKGFECKTETLNRKSELVYKRINGIVRKFRVLYTYTDDGFFDRDNPNTMKKVVLEVKELV